MDEIVIDRLTKQYKDVTAVDQLSLTIRRGEIFALLGVNGAGKTTTLKMLSCLTKPTSGDATLHGKSITHQLQAVKKLIGVSPQETAVAPNLSARENLELMAGAHGFDREKARGRVEALLEQLSLGEVAQKRAGKLSGGWQRRLSIAMALVAEPRILFLDEPTLGLDVLARSNLWELIRSLKDKMTLILTTHYMEEAELLSDRVAILKNGRHLCTGTAQEIKDRAGAERFEDAFVKLVKEEAQ